ncbi:methyltransferase domain-containing protein [Paenibacillus donghaensis]|uniref:methyltransferase domain-containing protein n=1 Tax=Paenibacillus donghaensis TaxID=414771 RepID=UPI0018838B0A|nr:methyltransferase domain-containing protein [Paenibacillus donghaensis]MBE9913352.1 methyltransferase domain-containing protein [Paenibacillus donghaensis]
MKKRLRQVAGDPSPMYLYTYSSHETEAELCRMELRALFSGEEMLLLQTPSLLISRRQISPDRSPFLSGRMDVQLIGDSVGDIAERARSTRLLPEGSTFKVTYLKSGDPFSYEEQRALERHVGSRIKGKADMKKPDVTLGLISVQGTWLLGICHDPERAWRLHIHKPQNYSTGLSVATARSLVNIMAPHTEGIRAVDPCCGMGNVLIEALSMGIDIRGRDINPLAVRGARTNLKHYGYSTDLVTLGDMNEMEGRFDAAILDMPYNLCSVISVDEQKRMLTSLRRLAPRSVIVATEEDVRIRVEEAGYRITDECSVWKGNFVRHVWLCEG